MIREIWIEDGLLYLIQVGTRFPSQAGAIGITSEEVDEANAKTFGFSQAHTQAIVQEESNFSGTVTETLAGIGNRFGLEVLYQLAWRHCMNLHVTANLRLIMTLQYPGKVVRPLR